MLTEQNNQPVMVGDDVYDRLSAAVAHAQSAQFFVIQRDREAVERWIDEAIIDLEAARAGFAAVADRPLRRHIDVTASLEAVDA